MTSVRQDAWTKDEDLLLAEVVLRHIREGSTQLKAFEEVGKKLNRTPAACGFRWNSTVRKQYKSGIELAKKQRKEGKKGEGSGIAHTVEGQGRIHKERTITLDDVIEYLQEIRKREYLFAEFENVESYKEKYEGMEKTINELKRENERLEKENRALKDEYLTLLSIMEKARKLSVKTEEIAGSIKGVKKEGLSSGEVEGSKRPIEGESREKETSESIEEKDL